MIMKKVLAISLPLDTDCFINNLPIRIVGLVNKDSRYRDYTVLIAYRGSYRDYGWKYGVYGERPAQELSSDHNTYDYYYWLTNTSYVYIEENPIIDKDQVCFLCKIIAPHKNKNYNDSFLCDPCRFLSDIDKAV